MSDTKLREDIARFGRSLFDRGLTHGASGNISVRSGDGGLLVTPTGVSLGSLDPGSLSRFTADGRHVEGPAATKEMPLHAALYATRSGAEAIVHLHSTHSVAVSMLPGLAPDDVLPPLTAYYLMKVGRTALLPYHRPGDAQVEAAIRGLAGRYSAVLLANHGPVVAGASLEAAVWAMEELEATARLFLLLRGFDPVLVPADEIVTLRGD